MFKKMSKLRNRSSNEVVEIKTGEKTRVSLATYKYTVEPALLVQNICQVLILSIVRDLLFEKVCRVNLNFTPSTCDALLSSDNNLRIQDYKQEEIQLQKYMGKIMIWRTIFETVVPMLMIFTIGAWSDKYGQKIVMLFYVGSCLMESIALVICVGLSEANNVIGGWTILILSSFITSLTGGFLCYKMIVMNYISATTTLKDRTRRFGITNSFLIAGRLLGLFLAGMISSSSILGFTHKFILVLFIELALFLYIIVFVINDKIILFSKDHHSKNYGGMIRDLFDTRLALQSIRTVFKKREGNQRRTLLLLCLAHLCINSPLYGESGVIHLYTRYQFNWRSSDVSYFFTFKLVLRLVGNFIGVRVLATALKLSDNQIGILTCLNACVGSLIMWHGSLSSMFLGQVAAMMSYAALVIPRTKISKLFSANEMGKIGSFIAGLDCVNTLLSEMVYGGIYKYTLESEFSSPSTFFLFSAFIMIPPILIFRNI